MHVPGGVDPVRGASSSLDARAAAVLAPRWSYSEQQLEWSDMEAASALALMAASGKAGRAGQDARSYAHLWPHASAQPSPSGHFPVGQPAAAAVSDYRHVWTAKAALNGSSASQGCAVSMASSNAGGDEFQTQHVERAPTTCYPDYEAASIDDASSEAVSPHNDDADFCKGATWDVRVEEQRELDSPLVAALRATAPTAAEVLARVEFVDRALSRSTLDARLIEHYRRFPALLYPISADEWCEFLRNKTLRRMVPRELACHRRRIHGRVRGLAAGLRLAGVFNTVYEPPTLRLGKQRFRRFSKENDGRCFGVRYGYLSRIWHCRFWDKDRNQRASLIFGSPRNPVNFALLTRIFSGLKRMCQLSGAKSSRKQAGTVARKTNAFLAKGKAALADRQDSASSEAGEALETRKRPREHSFPEVTDYSLSGLTNFFGIILCERAPEDVATDDSLNRLTFSLRPRNHMDMTSVVGEELRNLEDAMRTAIDTELSSSERLDSETIETIGVDVSKAIHERVHDALTAALSRTFSRGILGIDDEDDNADAAEVCAVSGNVGPGFRWSRWDLTAVRVNPKSDTMAKHMRTARPEMDAQTARSRARTRAHAAANAASSDSSSGSPLSSSYSNRRVSKSEADRILVEYYNRQHHPPAEDRLLLAERTGRTYHQINTWFANRRTRYGHTVRRDHEEATKRVATADEVRGGHPRERDAARAATELQTSYKGCARVTCRDGVRQVSVASSAATSAPASTTMSPPLSLQQQAAFPAVAQPGAGAPRQPLNGVSDAADAGNAGAVTPPDETTTATRPVETEAEFPLDAVFDRRAFGAEDYQEWHAHYPRFIVHQVAMPDARKAACHPAVPGIVSPVAGGRGAYSPDGMG